MAENPKIPKLELEKFTFSPPGPMGWDMAEYEKMLENPDQLVLNENTVNSQLQSLQSYNLVELSLSGELKKLEPAAMNKNHPPSITNESEPEPELETKLESELESEPVYEFEYEESAVEEKEVVEVSVPKRKVTIIVEETALKLPWLTPKLLSSAKKQQ